MTASKQEWFFTAPIEDIAVRRGDPLGMRAAAEEFSEELAPGLTNGTIDGRWLSILCWALEKANLAWRWSGSSRRDDDPLTRQESEALYSWLRPLELLWIARTVNALKEQADGRQLPGVRAVRRWINEGCKGNRFGLSASSYARYRFAGPYGTYRSALRALPGLTLGGYGWRLGPLGRELARVAASQVDCRQIEYRAGRKAQPEVFWLNHFRWNLRRSQFLPSPLHKPSVLGRDERELLRHALFSMNEGSDNSRRNGARRFYVVEAAEQSRAQNKPDLLADVAHHLRDADTRIDLLLLGPFCKLADAGVDAMNACWQAAVNGGFEGFVPLSSLLAVDEIGSALRELVKASERWLGLPRKINPRLLPADELAQSISQSQRISRSRRLGAQLEALMRHHQRFGGGLKWLAIEDGKLKPLARAGRGGASLYQFRILALCRLAVQAGVIGKLPEALAGQSGFEAEDEA